MRCRSCDGTIGYYPPTAPFVDGPASTCLSADPGLGPPSGVSIGRLSGVGALWDCVSLVCGGGGGCAGSGVPLGAGPCCPDVGRCLSGVNIISQGAQEHFFSTSKMLGYSIPIPWYIPWYSAFTRQCFTLQLLCGSQSPFYCPLPPALPALLQYYCTSIEK